MFCLQEKKNVNPSGSIFYSSPQYPKAMRNALHFHLPEAGEVHQRGRQKWNINKSSKADSV